jgi:hypothetical protein
MEDQSAVFINMTNVIYKGHPDLTENGDRSTLTLTQIVQDDISERALFHLLTSTNMPVQSILNTGLIPDSEQELALLNDGSSIVSVRTGVSFEDINLYREEIDYNKDITLMNAIYLQHLTYGFSKFKFSYEFHNFTLENVDINVTGSLIQTQDPLNLVIENVNIDAYSLYNGFDIKVSCNYPEANQVPIVYAENVTVITSTDRSFVQNPSFIDSNMPGNYTLK